MRLDLVIGETGQIESSDKDKLQDIASRVKDLNARLHDIRREQVFQRVSFLSPFVFHLLVYQVTSSNSNHGFYSCFFLVLLLAGIRYN